VYVAKYAPLN